MNYRMTFVALVSLPIGFVLSLHKPAAEQISVDHLQYKNKAIVQGYMDRIVNQGRWEDWERYFSEDLTFNGSPITKHQLRNMVNQMRHPIPNLQLTIEDQRAEGDTVVTRVTFHGLAANGKRIEYMGIGIDRLSDGRIVEMWHLADDPIGNEAR